jgi:sulfofructose kinase
MAALDEVFRVDRFPTGEGKTRADSFTAVTGGCAANAAVAIARLGGRVRLAAPLGGPDDATGDRIVAGLTREGVDCGGIVRVAGTTSPLSTILVDAAGRRMIVNHRDERFDDARLADPAALIGDAAAVLVDDLFPRCVLPICEAARARAIPVVLDAERPARHADALFDACSHVIFSAQALRDSAGIDDLATALRRVDTGAHPLLAVTDGANDILWLDGATMRRLPVFAVDAVDTLAAGDVFHGAFALALAEGRAEHDALRFAAAAAAIKCTRFGGGAGAPERAEVEALLARSP